MARYATFASLLIAASAAACISPTRSVHGYVADEAQPSDMKPGEDTRSSVTARLGTPSTKSVFDDNTWFYITTTTKRFAFYRPQVDKRRITAIRFGDDGMVEDVLEYDAGDGEVVNYVSRETPTLGRQLSLIEQLLGSIGAVGLPRTDEATPGNPTGQRNPRR
jgi:outer membrane protein assembly factor BamE (lipoprotein component of BamABCDE complex)